MWRPGNCAAGCSPHPSSPHNCELYSCPDSGHSFPNFTSKAACAAGWWWRDAQSCANLATYSIPNETNLAGVTAGCTAGFTAGGVYVHSFFFFGVAAKHRLENSKRPRLRACAARRAASGR